jgi:hypothetical protein
MIQFTVVENFARFTGTNASETRAAAAILKPVGGRTTGFLEPLYPNDSAQEFETSENEAAVFVSRRPLRLRAPRAETFPLVSKA